MTLSRAEILELDRRHVWHPYTPMSRHLESGPPLVIERAERSRLYDLDGRSYIDGNASWWVALLGHGHPRLLRVLEEQSRALCHVALAGITHEPAAALAAELCAVAPSGLTRVFFSDDGSTAVDLAVKICLQYWHQNGRPERRRFISLRQAFHGETLGATALGGVAVFRAPFEGALLDCVHVPAGADFREHGSRALRELLERDADHIAGCVVEPMVQGAGGMRLQSAESLREIRELTAFHDVFLVVDEVFTGYGRTGPMWACEHAGISPDVLCTAKGFTAGLLPMAATLTSERIFEGFLGTDERALFYGHTYCGHPLGAAIAREVLAIYREERILELARPKAERMRQALDEIAGLPGVSEPRALGMVAAFKVGNASGYLERAGWRVCEEARQRGAYLRPLGDVVYLTPALNIPDHDLEELLLIVKQSVRAALA